ncbi:hypothetical protein A8924_5028 [Saccharopolyspora erythraea NRRL 2338]|uniref:Secreted protein n=1 Tax=Saccharopolyspora erythraea TaxID=1836 RepID=A0ABN1CS65_SACER|nr:hypothetical protein [Saccharopolyspora erythraea]PFG97586.1 hypothetical protein A8924_5028 [Saccharopolyspora erythraea NRRL 2338]
MSIRTGTALAVALAAVVGTAGTASAQDVWTGEEFPTRPGMASYVTTAAGGGGATWAFGSYSPAGSPMSITAQAFRREDTGVWVEAPVPDIGQIVGSAVTGPDSAWAVSQFTKVSAGATIHWDGRAWTEVPLEVPDAPRISPRDVTAVGSDVWTIGKAYRDGNAPLERSFAMRWQDGGWQPAALPPAADQQSFTSVGGIAPVDVWMAGTTVERPQQIVSMHWDAVRWSHVQVPPVDTGDSDFLTVHDVAAYKPDDVWISATKASYDNPEGRRPILMHWDGARWSRQQPPVQTGGLGELVHAEGALWNLGIDALLRYDGTSWQPVDGPRQGALVTGAELPDGRLVGTGSQGSSYDPQPFAAVHGR